MSAADWRSLDANPSGIFLTRTAAARRSVRVGDTVTVNSGPGPRRTALASTTSRSSDSSPIRRGGSGFRRALGNPETIVGICATSKTGGVLTSRISSS